MPKLDGYTLSFPLLGGKLISDPHGMDVKSVIGTCFYIGNGFYITAGHVMKEAIEFDFFALGVTESLQPWSPFKIEEWETNEDLDVSVFRTEHIIKKAFPWTDKYVDSLVDVLITGYPHALSKEPPGIFRRDFKGYIITRRPYYRLKAIPNIYELSIPCPRGISGAFVLDNVTGKICGIVIGTDKSELDLHYITEDSIEKDGKTIYHKTETSTYGIAVTSKDILQAEFRILGGSFSNFLREQNLLD